LKPQEVTVSAGYKAYLCLYKHGTRSCHVGTVQNGVLYLLMHNSKHCFWCSARQEGVNAAGQS